MRNIKRNLAGAITIALAMSSVPAYASDINVSSESQRIVVKDSAYPGSGIMLLVVKKGADVNNTDNIYAMKYAEAGDDGTVVFNFDMPDDRIDDSYISGEYDLYIREGTSSETTDEFVYMTVGSREEIIEDIKDGADFNSVLSNPDNVAILETMGCNISSYNDLEDESDKLLVANMMSADIDEISSITIEEFYKKFNSALALVLINNSDHGPYDTYVSQINPEFENKKYNDVADTTLVSWIETQISNVDEFDSIDGFESFYKKMYAYHIINTMRVDDVNANIEKYATLLEIDGMDGYEAYIDLKKTRSADEKVVTALKKKAVNNPTDLDKVLKDASKPSGGNGGNGGDSGISSSPISGIGGMNTGVVATPPVVAGSNIFSDVSSVPWATDAIINLSSKGIIKGYTDGTFKPSNSVTREEFVTMLVNALGLVDSGAECSFNDVDSSAWYYKYVASAYSKGIVNGTPENNFVIGQNLTRQDMVTICMNAVSYTNGCTPVREDTEFADQAQISEYAKGAVSAFYRAGYINGVGDNMFQPLGVVTRAQAAVLINNIIK